MRVEGMISGRPMEPRFIAEPKKRRKCSISSLETYSTRVGLKPIYCSSRVMWSLFPSDCSSRAACRRIFFERDDGIASRTDRKRAHHRVVPLAATDCGDIRPCERGDADGGVSVAQALYDITQHPRG